MKLQPVGKNLLIKEMKEEKKSVLIYTPQNDEPRQVEIVGVGEKVEIPVKEGDFVLVRPYAGQQLSEGGEYLILSENDIVGVMRSE